MCFLEGAAQSEQGNNPDDDSDDNSTIHFCNATNEEAQDGRCHHGAEPADAVAIRQGEGDIPEDVHPGHRQEGQDPVAREQAPAEGLHSPLRQGEDLQEALQDGIEQL